MMRSLASLRQHPLCVCASCGEQVQYSVDSRGGLYYHRSGPTSDHRCANGNDANTYALQHEAAR